MCKLLSCWFDNYYYYFIITLVNKILGKKFELFCAGIFVFCIITHHQSIIIIHHRQFFKLVVCRVANSHEKKLMV